MEETRYIHLGNHGANIYSLAALTWRAQPRVFVASGDALLALDNALAAFSLSSPHRSQDGLRWPRYKSNCFSTSTCTYPPATSLTSPSSSMLGHVHSPC